MHVLLQCTNLSLCFQRKYAGTLIWSGITLLFRHYGKDYIKGYIERRNLVPGISHDTYHAARLRALRRARPPACVRARDGCRLVWDPFGINYHSIPSKLPLIPAPVGLYGTRARAIFQKSAKLFGTGIDGKRLSSACLTPAGLIDLSKTHLFRYREHEEQRAGDVNPINTEIIRAVSGFRWGRYADKTHTRRYT